MAIIPASVADLTPEWLTEVLRAGGQPAPAEVTAVAFEPLGGTESLASDVVRLSLTYGGNGTAGPADLVAKLPSTHEEERRAVFGRRAYQREADFYRALAASAGIGTPSCFYADHDEAELRYCILLEYLDAGAPGSNEVGASADEIMRGATALARMHARWWGSTALNQSWLLSHVDADRFMARLPAAVPVFMERLGDLVPARLRTAVLTITQWLPQKYAELSTSGVTLLHGDCSVKNLFFPSAPSAPVIAFDWSLVGYGPAARDLVNLIVVSCAPDTRGAVERDAVALYHQSLLGGGVEGYTFDDAWRDYRLATLMRFGSPILNASGPRAEWLQTAEVTARRIFAAAEDLNVVELL